MALSCAMNARTARPIGMSGRHTHGIMEHPAGNDVPRTGRFLTGNGCGARAGAVGAGRGPAGVPRADLKAQERPPSFPVSQP